MICQFYGYPVELECPFTCPYFEECMDYLKNIKGE